MPINNTGGPVSLSAIRTELALSSKNDFKIDGAENGDISDGYVPINQCSPLKPSTADPTSFSEWRGYDHSTPCGSTQLGMVYCNYTPTSICDLQFDTSTATNPTTGTTVAQETSVALSYVGCLLWDLYVGNNAVNLTTADYEWSAKLTFTSDENSTSYSVKPSTVNSERHYPTDKLSATDCYLIAASGVSAGGYGFVRTALNIYKVMQVFPTTTTFYVHVYGKRRNSSVPANSLPMTYNLRKQTLVNRPSNNGVDFGITIPESNNTQVSINFPAVDLNYRRVGYFLYNKATDTVSWTAV